MGFSYWKGDGKVTFTRYFLMLGKVIFDEQVNVLERYCKHDTYNYYTIVADDTWPWIEPENVCTESRHFSTELLSDVISGLECCV